MGNLFIIVGMSTPTVPSIIAFPGMPEGSIKANSEASAIVVANKTDSIPKVLYRGSMILSKSIIHAVFEINTPSTSD